MGKIILMCIAGFPGIVALNLLHPSPLEFLVIVLSFSLSGAINAISLVKEYQKKFGKDLWPL